MARGQSGERCNAARALAARPQGAPPRRVILETHTTVAMTLLGCGARQPTSARTFSVAYFRDPAKIAQAKAELAEARKGPWPEPPSPRSAAAASAAAPKKRGGAGGAARGRSPTRRSESKRSEGKRGESKRAEAKSRGASRGAGRSSSRGASAEGSARSGSRGRARTGRPISRGAMEARNRLLPAHSEMRRRGTSAVDDPAFERDPTRPLSRGAYETRNKLLPAYSQVSARRVRPCAPSTHADCCVTVDVLRRRSTAAPQRRHRSRPSPEGNSPFATSTSCQRRCSLASTYAPLAPHAAG